MSVISRSPVGDPDQQRPEERVPVVVCIKHQKTTAAQHNSNAL